MLSRQHWVKIPKVLKECLGFLALLFALFLTLVALGLYGIVSARESGKILAYAMVGGVLGAVVIIAQWLWNRLKRAVKAESARPRKE
jgi:hypothetical protein